MAHRSPAAAVLQLVASLALLVSLGGWGASPGAAAPRLAPLCFAQTSQCIDGRFREYWEHNGGLAVFGFPITPARNELNRDTGQTYLTQWFERNRFELHSELARPYDVLLGRLGDDRLRQLGRTWGTEPRDSGPQAGCLWFAATRLNVCNQEGSIGFRAFWETNGLKDPALGSYGQSLALFGLPLTQPRMETNSAGDTVLTQWFERARFEHHPGKPQPYKVLLGLLGSEVGPPAGPPGPAPTPAPPPPSFNNCQADPFAAQAPNFPVKIVGIDKVREVVRLHNVGSAPVDLTGWRMCSITGNQEHGPIGGVLQPGEGREFTNAGGNIWNNTGQDDGALYDRDGRLISYWGN